MRTQQALVPGLNWLIPESTWVMALLFGLTSLAAVSLVIGCRTRFATVTTGVGLTLIQQRNPLLLDCADSYLAVLLLWGALLPLGGAWSYDARQFPRSNQTSTRHVSPLTACVLLQICGVYLATALLKSGPDWRSEGSAVAYVLNSHTYPTAVGIWLVSFPKVTTFLTSLVWRWELVGPVLLLFSGVLPLLRVLVVVTFAAMHLAFASCLHLGIFTPVAAAGLLLFLPSEVWDRWAPTPTATVVQRSLSSPRLVNVLGTTLLLLAVTTVATELSPIVASSPTARYVREWTNASPLRQNWRMFAPQPRRLEAWYSTKGVTATAQELELILPHQRPLTPTLTEPKSYLDFYGSERWVRYFERLSSHREYLDGLADFFCRRANTTAATIREVRVYRSESLIESSGRKPLIQHQLVFGQFCNDRGSLNDT